MDLSQLTIESAKSLEGQHFEIALPDGGNLRLLLDAVMPFELRQRRPLRGSQQPKRAPFALYFLGPPVPLLPQGIYDLRHPESALGDVFIVPLGQDAETVEYEAVFT